MALEATSTLYQLNCYSDELRIGLVNYADLIITDEENNIVGLRFGGYPEHVTAMTDAITTGCGVSAYYGRRIEKLSSREFCNFTRSTARNGIYAESVLFLKDSDINVAGNKDDDKEKEAPLRTMYLYCKTDSKEELFAELDKKLSIPLITDFTDYLIEGLEKKKMLQKLSVRSESVKLTAYRLTVKDDEKDVVKILAEGLKAKKIKIPGEFKAEAAPGSKDIFLEIKGFSDYLMHFGKLIAEKIKKSFVPLFDPEKEKIHDKLVEVNEYIEKNVGYELFDAQLAAAEGVKRELDKAKLALIIAECGSGKTKIGAAALYAHQKKKSPGAAPAFNAVICPSHVCEKWVRELHESIPNCYARVIDSFKDIEKMHSIYKTGNKSVYCVISKEKARDGYMKEPAVIWSNVKRAFICPDCDEIQMMPYFEDGVKYMVKADSLFYRRETSLNHKCENCKTVLWSALNPDSLDPKRNRWVKISDYGFVHREFVGTHLYIPKQPEKYIAEFKKLLKTPDMIIPAKGAYRRYPLSLYIKKKIGRIDGFIADELHEYSGDSGQGQAMAEIAKAAKKTIAMTATLINGYSKGIFYLLFRLAPLLMKFDEQSYSKSTEFCRQYGVVEQTYTQELSKINSNSKAKRSKTREKFLPGVSPLVYTRFLLDNAVFLSLEDMGKELPDYEEIPVPVKLTKEIKEEYDRLQEALLEIIKKDRRMAQKLMSTYLNLLTAYPDQPYGHPPVLNPFFNEEILVKPADIGDAGCILPKDKEVIDLVERKVKAGERVIIFTAWVRLDTQDKLYNELTKKGYRVKILDAKVPAKKREAWVEKQVKDGIDVLITNPSLVQTGLDLNAFTTLAFFNLAFNLYIFRQASRRSWRINQTAPKVEVYMFYYIDTMQHKALKLMASKLSAATVIEGGISDEGLAALSQCEDITSQMAKELAAGIKDSVEDLSATFKRMALIKDKPVKTVESETAQSQQKQKPVIQMHKAKSDEKYKPVQYTLFDLLAG